MNKIAIITATRAEYGILKPLITALNSEADFDVSVIVTGTHLCEEYGLTYRNIEADGIDISAKIELPMRTNSPADVSKCMAVAIEKFAEYFESNRPDLLIVLGDRFEIPAFCIAAVNERIPIAHIAGGETTEGAVDEVYRHAVTKMSYLHFTTADEYRNRVIQLGESPDRVYNVGSLMIESIKGMTKVPKDELNAFLGFELGRKYALVTFHPVTLEDMTAGQQARSLIDAMTRFPQIDFICTKANADVGGIVINEMLEKAAEQYDNIHLYASLGQARYLSLMSEAALVLGNTSSGIGEAPMFLTPTVNIGDRQKGRLRADSVIDCSTDVQDICTAIEKAVSDDFIKSIQDMKNPYGDGNASSQIVSIIKKHLEEGIDLKKQFYDIEKDNK